MRASRVLLLAVNVAVAASTNLIRRNDTTDVNSVCSGYTAKNVKESPVGLTAELSLVGDGCGIFGVDVEQLRLEVHYDTESRIHVRITDATEARYEVPQSVFPRASISNSTSSTANTSDIVFNLVEQPFSFSVARRSTGEKLFDTAGTALIYEDRYLHLQTQLSEDPNIYGIGEHTNSFRLPNRNLTRTLWARDAYGVPVNTNLYSSHPIYFEHRLSGTHGVFLLNSNGMDVKIDAYGNGTKLEYNVIGGILDLYFFAGPGPADVAQQYSELAGLPALTPYWGLGNHQCRYGYRDWIDIAEVIGNYSAAGIPLETMWTDIDYMHDRWIMTLDSERFPLDKMQHIVSNLHNDAQHYIMMVDPAIAYQNYTTFQNGVKDDIFLKNANGSIYQGVVWPGVTAFPDWFHPNVTSFWNGEFARFFNAQSGVDIDGVWIDMNEPSNFCTFPCLDPAQFAINGDFPPAPPPVRSPPTSVFGFPPFTSSATATAVKRAIQTTDPNYYLAPPYAIQDASPHGLSDTTINTTLVHYNGEIDYNVHNLYGTMMSSATHDAMLARRPSLRPFVITRSTFAGAGKKVGHWLGDNLSDWQHYINSISGILQMSALYQIPMVGADVCGYGLNTTIPLCARWTTLGAFYTFYRNHNENDNIPQEPYRWPIVASAARNAILTRYKLLDYIYTALWKQSQTGVPTLTPLWFSFPNDEKTFGIDTEFMYGPAVLVAPVVADENATFVEVYLPPGPQWYELNTGNTTQSGNFTVEDVGLDAIPLYAKGGEVIPLRIADAIPRNTTAQVRASPFEIVVAPGKDDTAWGELVIDDGKSFDQSTLRVTFSYANGTLSVEGKGDYQGEGVTLVDHVSVLGTGWGTRVTYVNHTLVGSWTVKV